MISVRVNEVFQYLTASDEELLKKCHQCMEIIVSAKDRQAAEANRHASILLEQLDREKSLEESKKAAAARKREKRRRKKKEKQEQAQRDTTGEEKPKEEGGQKAGNKNSASGPKDDDDEESIEDDGKEETLMRAPPSATTSTTTGLPSVTEANNKNQAHKRSRNTEVSSNSSSSSESNGKTKSKKSKKAERERDRQHEREAEAEKASRSKQEDEPEEEQRVPDMRVPATPAAAPGPAPNNTFQHSILPSHNLRKKRQELMAGERHGIGDLDDFGVPSNIKSSAKEKERNKKNNEKSSKVSTLRDSFGLLSPGKGTGPKGSNVPSPKKNQKKEEGWKEVTRKSKKVTVPSNAISRVIGRGGCNINAIREVSGAHIDVDKQKGSGDRIVVIKGSAEATRQAHNLISALIKDPDKDLDHLLPKHLQRASVAQQNNNNTTTPSANHTASSSVQAASTNSSAATSSVCSTTPALPMAQIFSTSVWHNNMASHLSSSTSPVPSSSTTLHGKTTAGGKNPALSSSAASALAAAMTTSQLTAPFANVVRQSQSAGSHRLAPSGAPMGAFQTGPVPSPSPKRPGSGADGPVSAPGQSASPLNKSPSPVVRRLFQGEKAINVTTAKTSVTYSTVSMAKTKVVTATSQTFVSRVDSSSSNSINGGGSSAGPIGSTNSTSRSQLSNKSQHKPSSVGSPTPLHLAKVGQTSLVGSTMGGKGQSDPQPLPIKTSLSATRLASSQSAVSRPHMVSMPPSDYSPFNNRFSQELEMLGKKEESMNFASVAAAGVVPASSSVIGSVSPAPLDTQPDPSVAAKAPGYKAPNQQRTSSPLVVDQALLQAISEAQSRQAAASPGGGPHAANAIDVAVLEREMKSLAHHAGSFSSHPHHHSHHPHHPQHHPHHQQHQHHSHHHHHHPSNHQTMSNNEADPSKAPGYKGGYMDHPDMRAHLGMVGGGGFRPSSNLSPRSSNMSAVNAGPFSLLSQQRDEYSTPDQPMTLPKIESTLNPNAPDFTSRSFEPSGRFPHMTGLNMGPGFVPGYGSIGGLAGLGGSGAVPPAMGMHGGGGGGGGGGFRVQPPSGGVMSSADLLAPGADNGQVLTHMVNASFLSSASMVRQFKNLPPSGPSSSTTPPIGASSKGDSPIPAVASEPSPSSSSAPSPTDHHPGLVSADALPRPLRPIGTERAHKKPQVSGFSIPEAGAAGLWTFNSDLGPEWMSSVMTTSVVTSGVMTPGLSADGEDQVGGHLPPPPPVGLSSFPTPDSHMDSSVELPYGQAAAVVFAANGVPAGAAGAALPPMVYAQQGMTVDSLPSMWTHPVKVPPHQGDGPRGPDSAPQQDPSKLVRAHFTH